MVEICDRRYCSGCGACSVVCPHSAISMEEGRLGALYPVIDQRLCVDCGLCTKVCPAVTPVSLNSPEASYASYTEDSAERRTSASGGAAAMLTRLMLENGGVVYGCAQEGGVNIAHVRVDDVGKADSLKGSKYVQSDAYSVFKQVKKDLSEGREVLFVGVPCQVAGLKNLIDLKTGISERLYTVDLCCHGTPPQRLLREHLDFLKISSEADKVVFREKGESGIRYAFNVYDSGDRCIYGRSARDDFYMTGFLSGMFMRENCFSCPYACPERCADLTLADHWAMGESGDPEMKASKGLSTILVNTSRGRSLFERMSGCMVVEQRPMAEALRNGQFVAPAARPEDNEAFVVCLETAGYESACRKYLPAYQRRMLIEAIRSKYYKCPLRQSIRKLLKR